MVLGPAAGPTALEFACLTARPSFQVQVQCLSQAPLAKQVPLAAWVTLRRLGAHLVLSQPGGFFATASSLPLPFSFLPPSCPRRPSRPRIPPVVTTPCRCRVSSLWLAAASPRRRHSPPFSSPPPPCRYHAMSLPRLLALARGRHSPPLPLLALALAFCLAAAAAPRPLLIATASPVIVVVVAAAFPPSLPRRIAATSPCPASRLLPHRRRHSSPSASLLPPLLALSSSPRHPLSSSSLPLPSPCRYHAASPPCLLAQPLTFCLTATATPRPLLWPQPQISHKYCT